MRIQSNSWVLTAIAVLCALPVHADRLSTRSELPQQPSMRPTPSRVNHLILRRQGAVAEVVLASGRVASSYSLAAANPIVIRGTNASDDTLTIDFSGGEFGSQGIQFDGGQGGHDSLKIIGDGHQRGIYTPSAATYGDGVVEINGVRVEFAGLEPVEVSDMASFTFVAPKPGSSVVVDAPETGKNRLSGNSGGTAFESLTFTRIPLVTVDFVTTESFFTNIDFISFIGPLAAEQLEKFRVNAGIGDDILAANEPVERSLIPGNEALLHYDGGAGRERFYLKTSADLAVDDEKLQLGDSADGPLSTVATFSGIGGASAQITGDAAAQLLDGRGWTGSLVAEGRAGADLILGGQGQNYFEGGLGDDFLDGSLGTLSGALVSGDGNFSANSATGIVTGAGTDRTVGLDYLDIRAGNSANVINCSRWTRWTTILSNGGDDTIHGSSNDDYIVAGDGNDRVWGYGGNDDISGQGGYNVLVGGEGNDRLTADFASEFWCGPGDDQSSGGSTGLTIRGGPGNDTLSGSIGNDLITGDEGDDRIYGGFGNDRLSGGVGNDRVEGETGNDRVYGDGGDDTLDGGEGDDLFCFAPAATPETDTLIERAAQGYDVLTFGALAALDPVTVDLSATTQIGSHQNRVLLVTSGQSANFEGAVGGAGDDVLRGNTGGNFLSGAAGNDTLSGNSGNDVLRGGSGNDSLSGESGNDRLYGDTGDDALFGGDDNDQLDGGADTDALDGGPGTDTAVNGETISNVP
jgi:Ca2+-binding RTX toxin-like protein